MIASNSFDGLVHAEDGKLKFPEGNIVGGANTGKFAQITDKDSDSAIEAAKKEAVEYIASKEKAA